MHSLAIPLPPASLQDLASDIGGMSDQAGSSQAVAQEHSLPKAVASLKTEAQCPVGLQGCVDCVLQHHGHSGFVPGDSSADSSPCAMAQPPTRAQAMADAVQTQAYLQGSSDNLAVLVVDLQEVLLQQCERAPEEQQLAVQTRQQTFRHDDGFCQPAEPQQLPCEGADASCDILLQGKHLR